MADQPVGELGGGLRLRRHPHMQGAHAAHQQPGIERAQHGADLRPHLADALPQRVLLGGRQRAGHHVGMAVEILGAGMHHEVGAERQRPREDRRRDGRVHAQQRARGMGEVGDGGDVGDAPHRIARRLDPHQSGLARPQRGAHRVEVAGIDEADGVSAARRHVGQPRAQAVIHHARDHDVGRPVERLEDGAGRRHPRAEHQRLRGAFQRGQQLAGLLHRGIVRSAIDAPAAIAIVGRAQVGIAQVGRRHMDRRHQSADFGSGRADALGDQGACFQRQARFMIHGRPFAP
ncbi:hypothetical protein BH11PSE3_BH11PSE3_37830 [soil metagenome]